MKRKLFAGNSFGLSVRPRTPSSIAAAAGWRFDALEPRQMLTVNVLIPIGPINVQPGSSATLLDLIGRYDDPDITGSITRFNSVLGAFNIEMFDAAGAGRSRTTPDTVANFLAYINAGRYRNTFAHRSVPNFVLQGGGFTAAPLPTLFQDVPAFDPVFNEPGNSNVRGTIAMAKSPNQPNSATNQWFINLANNAATLDTQNGGFTAFGRVLGSGMDVVDALAAVPTFNFSSPFDDVPLRNFSTQDFNNGVSARPDNLLLFSNIEAVPELTFTVSSDNALVTPVLVGNRLVLNYAPGQSGAANITFRITSANGSFVEDNFAVNVSGAPNPTQGVVTVTPARVGSLGPLVTLTGNGVYFQAANLQSVTFYRDINNNGLLDLDESTAGFLGVGSLGPNGWELDVETDTELLSGVSGGQIFIARGFFSGTGQGAPMLGANSFNMAPSAGFFSIFAPQNPQRFNVVRNLGDDLRMDMLVPSDPDGTIASAQFFRDGNGNGTFESGIDILLGEDTTPNDGFSLTVPTTGFTVGIDTAIFSRVTDNEGRVSDAVSRTIRVNAAPTIASLTLSTATLTRGQPLTLTANNVDDTDSGNPPATPRVQKVDFFRDSNGNGTFETETDQFLGSATIPITGTSNYSLTVSGAVTSQFAAGTVLFFARPADNDFAFGGVQQASLTISNQNPTLNALAATPAILGNIGGTITLVATGAADPDGTVASVRFYRAADAGNPNFDIATAILLGEDTSPANGFSLAVNTGNAPFGFTLGTNRYFAVAVDTDGGTSAATTTTSRINTPPTLGALTSNPTPIVRANNFTLTAAGPTDTDGTIARVEFYVDSNGNGTLDVGSDTLLGSDTSATGGYTLTRSALGLPLNSRFFARAVDNDGGVSDPSVLVTTLVNSPPTLTLVTVTPALVNRGNSFTLRSQGARDLDGTISGVDYYLDANGDGILQPDDGNGIHDPGEDFFLGASSTAGNSYALTVSTTNPDITFADGANRVFASVFDNDGTPALTPRAFIFRLNAAPIIGSVTGPAGPVARGTTTTVTANNVVDGAEAPPFAGTIAAVQFYRDSNGNDAIDASDRLLGTGTRAIGTNNYTLNFATTGFATGNNTVLVRARDNNGAFSALSPVIINIVNANPLVTSVTVAPSPVPFLGQNITITAVNPRDTDGTVAITRFYLETSGDNTLDVNTDTLLGQDSAAAGGWSLVVPTALATGFAVGANRVYAVVEDNDGGTVTAAQNFNITATNAAPTIGSVTAPNAARLTLFNITAANVVDTDPGNTVTRVEFYLDSNHNDTFDLGVDRLLGTAVPAAGNAVFRATASGVGFQLGSNTIFARARDNRNVFGDVTQGAVVITNQVPTLTSHTAVPPIIPNIGSTVTLTAAGATDRDGTINRVDFYRDADANGVFDPATDTLLGSDSSAVGGFRLAVDTEDPAFGFIVGNNQLFAVAVDNDGGLSAARSVTRRINAAPTIGGVTVANPLNPGQPILRGGNAVVTASNVVDTGEATPGTITTVQVYRDVNSNGVIDSADRLLGTATRLTGTNDFRLTFRTTGFPQGNSTILVRARDNNNGESAPTSVIVEVSNVNPTFTSTRVTPATITFFGQPIIITAVGPRDSDGTIVQTLFFLETTGDNVLDPAQDLLIGEDNSATGGWAVTIATLQATGFVLGPNRVYACVIDNDGGNLAIGQNVTIAANTNAAPFVGSVNPTTNPVNRNNSTTLVAAGLTDADGTVTRVEFFVDSDGDGVFTPGADASLGVATVSAGQASRVVNTRGFPTGAVTVFARAQDNRQAFGGVTSGTITVNNLTPLITSVTASPNPIVALGATLNLTANAARDNDGTISAVEFYFDTNNNGALDIGIDVLLGSDTSSVGGFRLAVDTDDPAFGLAPGMNRFIARVVDNDGASATAATVVRFNAAPTITSIDVTPNPIARTGTYTVSVGGVLDDGGVSAVQLFRDSNGNGVLDAADALIGNARRSGTSANWIFTGSGAALPAGTYMIFARARDTNGVFSAATAVSVTVA